MIAVTFEETEEGRAIRVDVPNLDCMEGEELILFARSLGFFGLLVEYARTKESARRCRLAGMIETAQKLESHCETLYQQLPAGARW
jgi:hypothetical protein